ncbi:serine hydrolase domain-containing protein [Sphingomonas kyeonggiensis]|uniref:CubicO group peptidase (Beta-lactamase class C family) n=1 Tax=Sphingomonas kyeonggiensis TaxID=1268553 RepID=A0A7W6JNM0_9SPHN|nr:serine hydrolase domain-containing protein [Sphingomonas kyeonggiensis]MBB4096702.1 CubicO group peptidase (beta-lactamase class C family) [Sphingomonas kyeonggiensis]
MHQIFRILASSIALTIAHPATARDVTSSVAKLDAAMQRWMPGIVREEKIGGIGIAVIRDGRLIWSGHYGEQSPGVPITPDTVFNTASIAKTVTAETLLALEAAKRISLDEPIASYVPAHDLDRDPRYKQLTLRILLSHRSGLRNWPDDYPDGKLAFDWAPGTRYRYSGAGIELAARYAEAKTGKPLRVLAQETVLSPWGIDRMAIGTLPSWSTGRLAMPVGPRGDYLDFTTLYPGLRDGSSIGAAYDLLTTTGAYGRLLEGLIAASASPSRTRSVRETILTPLNGDERYGCERRFTRRCPDRYGYAFGWQIHHYSRHRILQHTGNDEGETDLVYFSPDRRTGAAIFVNGANGWAAIARAVEIIGDEPELADYYRGLLAKLFDRQLAPLPPSKSKRQPSTASR